MTCDRLSDADEGGGYGSKYAVRVPHSQCDEHKQLSIKRRTCNGDPCLFTSHVQRMVVAASRTPMAGFERAPTLSLGTSEQRLDKKSLQCPHCQTCPCLLVISPMQLGSGA